MFTERFNEYQDKAVDTAIYDKSNLSYPALGLCGEAGEVAEKIKKIIRDKGGVVSQADAEEIAKELGDVLWYVANLASDLGFDLGYIASLNVEKLADRKARNVIKGSGDNR